MNEKQMQDLYEEGQEQEAKELCPGGNPHWRDFVEVVRCKDCKWSFHDANGTLLCEEWECQDTLPYWYCAGGERRGV